MVICGAHRKERTHCTGASNRARDALTASGPIDFDASMRSTAPRKMDYKVDTHVPAHNAAGNQDFAPKLPGHDFRQPKSDPVEHRKIMRETREREAATQTFLDKTKVQTVVALNRDGSRVDQAIRWNKEEGHKDNKQKGQKVAPRWNPSRWYDAPKHEQAPLQRDEGETWNHMESHQVQGEIKGQDRLMRTVRRPEDVATPQSESGGGKHPLQHDHEEYYPGRSLVDAASEEPGNDFQVRPTYLPDFYNPPPPHGDSGQRMQRMREVIKQRYAGRPGLMGVFRNCALQKPGFVFPKDLQQVFDQMGVRVGEDECRMLVQAVDKDGKGAVAFEEFADLIYGPRVNVGGAPHEAQERHVRHVTKTLVDTLVTNSQGLGKAFCELDPERRYLVSRQQFANAIGTACNHVSGQAIDFLWASQFSGQPTPQDDACIDWRNFMSQLAHFSHDHRPPTPCCVQGRKRQYDLLQRTAPLTGGVLEDLDLNRPDQSADDTVTIIADKLVHRTNKLPSKPRDTAHLTEHYVEELRTKATRVERALPKRIPKGRLQELLKNREMVHQDELIDLICAEIEGASPPALPKQEPLYAAAAMSAGAGAEVMTLDPKTLGDATSDANPDAPAQSAVRAPMNGYVGPACLKLVRADIEAFVGTQRVNRDHEVDVDHFVKDLYRPPDEKKSIERVNDGLNRALRGHRPPRERPKHGEEGQQRYSNYWQARYMMETLQDAIAVQECSNGGKIKPSRIFKCVDMDNDCYITLSDLQTACEKYKVPHTSADLHAVFSELDRDDNGSINIGEFTRNFEVHAGSMVDQMQKPIKAVYHEGGTHIGGPVQEKLDAREQELLEREQREQLVSPGKSHNDRSTSAPPQTGGSKGSQMSRTGSSIAGSASIIYAPQVDQLTGKATVSEVIRARHSAWKPTKAELYTSMPKTRYGMTIYPDTRHCTEANVPLSHSYMPDHERFKTTNNVMGLFSTPDHKHPQAEDTMNKHARNEFRVERIRQRQRDFAERCWAANEAAQNFDELKIARKALNQLNYERKCKMSCG